jgi:succinate dehydrogenase/fumarate reductase flavoprotein subunit
MGKPTPEKNVDRRSFLKGAALAALAPAAQAATLEHKWNQEADVVVIGSGAAGLPAAIIARENGASVIVVEANSDIGGHAAVCTGNIALGGGTAAQKAAGIVDSPDILFRDLTDWSVVGGNGAGQYRYNDRDIVRAFADNNVFAYDFLVAHGLIWTNPVPDRVGMNQAGQSAPRAMHAAIMQYERIQTGIVEPPDVGRTTAGGVGIVRPLEAAARKAGVQILLNHRMTGIIREDNNTGRVTGITVESKGAKLNIRARKGVIVCTGGSTGNVEFRRIYDPRLTEEYCSNAGEPYTTQDASGEIAGMEVGASLWGTANMTAEYGAHISKPGYIGCQHGYPSMFPTWQPTSKYFHLARATGLKVANYQNLICVNQVGVRFYDETKGAFGNAAATLQADQNYQQNSWRNAANNKWDPMGYLPAAMGLNGGTGPGGGPIWAIFDADAVTRETWTVAPPYVDREAGFFFSGNTLAELATALSSNKYMKKPMSGQALQETVARYNSFVDTGKDADFDKPAPMYKIQKPPFYAAWATPVTHDTRAGLRVNASFQVHDLKGKVIPGLYCAGESAGGFGEHGISRCVVGGLIAGRHAAAEKV